ncbi:MULTISPECIES: MoaD/ThiS family protein [unclassified Archaeoglobus]|uniref:MoaD/ThiS family protein n=1 Tax=unclassified Archaeoglobus TaxID=2643606 RepID=UPI0025C01DF0|nr:MULTISPECIES: MoaD/ThiS family protein [unclassified Archaeoglobus]
MKARIELYATLREKYGKSVEVECDGTLKGAFLAASKKLGEDFLKEVFDEEGNFRDDRIITVNGRNIKDEIIEKLPENARIAVFPPVAGGL